MEHCWITPKVDPSLIVALEDELELGPLTAAVLVARGFASPALAEEFLSANLKRDWGEPFDIPGMKEVAESVEAAIRANRRILIFGDYDVDGLASAALLYRALREFGAADVGVIIPRRQDEGYGLSEASVERIKTYRPDVLITVDCGISAYSEIAELVGCGIEVIVTDHHEPASILPAGIPMTDPKLDPSCPDTILAGVALALKLVEALSKRFGKNNLWLAFTDLAALGTLSDIMTLQGKNRALVKDGLSRMNTSLCPGLATLQSICAPKTKRIDSAFLTFSIIPRLNAAGRMGDAQLSLALLLTDDVYTSYALAQQLEELNTERKNTENLLYGQIDTQVAAYPKDARALILWDADWHDGVKGIMASRFAKAYGVPTILFSIEDGIARGSGRTVGSINLFEAIEKCSDLFMRFGGHGAAVGITLAESNLPIFRERLEAIIADEPEESFYQPLCVDASIRLSAVDIQTVKDLAVLEPHGQGNPEPIFVAENVFITRARAIGHEKNHLVFTASDGLSEREAIWFSCPDIDYWLANESAVDVAFTPHAEVWNKKSSLKLHVKAVFEKQGFDAGQPPPADSLAPADSSVPANPDLRFSLPANHSDWRFSLPANPDWRFLAKTDPISFAETFVAKNLGPCALLHAAQKAALVSLAQRRNTLVIMATGKGKSLIFQITAARLALAQGQASIFVFPLRALIHDQAFHLESLLERVGLKAVRLTGDITGESRQAAFEAFEAGEADIVLTTPEFFEIHIERITKAREIGFLVFDEAHHIATSSSHHRAVYTRFETLAKRIPGASILAATATADTETAQAIVSSLGIKTLVVDPGERSNLHVVDRRNVKDRERYVASLVASNIKTLVYVGRRDEALELTRLLRKLVPALGHRIVFYHAGLTRADRNKIEQAFRCGEVSCVVCTSAFGEGVAIPDIRAVVLYQIPYSAIDFNQISGRAGRDGLPAEIYLVFNADSVLQNSRILASNAPSRDDLALVWHVLRKMGYDSFDLQKEVSLMDKSPELSLGELISPRDPCISEITSRCSGSKQSYDLGAQGVIAALDIFEDIGLVTLNRKENGWSLAINEPKEKADLNKSPRYLEGLRERAAFEDFCAWLQNTDAEKIAARIRRPIVPDANLRGIDMKTIRIACE